MKSPVLFIIFKRFDTALQVFERIREARPPRLYVAADAPRLGVDGEVEDCQKTRDIIKLVDWPCEVKTLFQTVNQGCGYGPYKAITWFFENEEQGIVLEDDCVAHPDFFKYMDEMLDRYRADERISLLTGRNVTERTDVRDGSYFLSGLHFCWGWASWRRTWAYYDYKLTNVRFWQYARNLYRLFGFRPLLIMWRLSIFMKCKLNPDIDAWDYQFAISTQMRGTYTIVPCVNLVHNVGFDSRATHTASDNYEDVPAHPIMPITHPSELKYNSTYDANRCRLSNRIRFIAGFARTAIKYMMS